MPTVFVYEYCCALGLGREPSDPTHSLHREGRAMRDAVAEDFLRVPGVVVVLSDHADARPPLRELDFAALARRCDYTLIIAPETRGELARRIGWAMTTPTRLLGPDFAGVVMPSDKQYLAEWWSRQGVQTPFTTPADRWPGHRFPAVVKPFDGAGSAGTALVHNQGEWNAALRYAEAEGYTPARVIAQDFVPGRPASVAFLIGPAQTIPLLPTFQLLSSDGRFRYEGGELPIPPDLADRAIALGRQAIGCVPGLLGYVGVDLVLGDAADGSRDYAIEINPRLTTSYVGLRESADFNLAGAMLRVVNGEPFEPRWKPGRVQFRPDGSVSVDPTPGPTSG
jgi:predicted ATP-grasp superfamily ATP-dependent carboligase